LAKIIIGDVHEVLIRARLSEGPPHSRHRWGTLRWLD